MKIQLDEINKVEVISKSRGRLHVGYHNKGVEIHTQDDGRTLKIFVK